MSNRSCPSKRSLSLEVDGMFGEIDIVGFIPVLDSEVDGW